MKLKAITEISATLKCVSGLHIGSGDAEMHIGGIDNCVVKNPMTNRPYIPGSSLKGKMRSLMEWKSGEVKDKPLGWKDYEASGQSRDVLRILQLFGRSDSGELKPEDQARLGPSRLSFWDCELTEKWVARVEELNALFTEDKSENSIKRISGVAENPRHTERVPAGSTFDFRLSVKCLEGDEDLIDAVLRGLKLLELDSIGGSGSRGYGKIRFENLRVGGVDRQKEFDGIDPFAG